jgi:hypothetical protein
LTALSEFFQCDSRLQLQQHRLQNFR